MSSVMFQCCSRRWLSHVPLRNHIAPSLFSLCVFVSVHSGWFLYISFAFFYFCWLPYYSHLLCDPHTFFFCVSIHIRSFSTFSFKKNSDNQLFISSENNIYITFIQANKENIIVNLAKSNYFNVKLNFCSSSENILFRSPN